MGYELRLYTGRFYTGVSPRNFPGQIISLLKCHYKGRLKEFLFFYGFLGVDEISICVSFTGRVKKNLLSL